LFRLASFGALLGLILMASSSMALAHPDHQQTGQHAHQHDHDHDGHR
jgi:hypothetical protein